jgi:hypothetical protein
VRAPARPGLGRGGGRSTVTRCAVNDVQRCRRDARPLAGHGSSVRSLGALRPCCPSRTGGSLGGMETIPAPAAATAVAESQPMLIDEALPRFDVTRREHLVVDAPVPRTWDALLTTDLLDVHTPLLDAAFWVRGLPARLKGGQTAPGPVSLRLDGDVPLEGWLGLGRREQRELALGAVGRFWQADITWRTVADAAEFAAFDEPGWGRIAANFSLRPYGSARTLLSYEARTAVPDDASRRKFAGYWGIVEPFVGHIMRATLRTVAADAARA